MKSSVIDAHDRKGVDDLSQKIRILLIEDSPSDAEYVREVLSTESPACFEVTWAERLSMAIEFLGQTPFDAALVDLSLPDSSGLDTVRRIRSNAPDMPVIVLTGLDDETTGLAAIKSGVEDYVVKGQFTGGLLPRVIRYAIWRWRMQRALKESEERYRDLFDNASDMVILVSADNRFLYVNQASERLLGYSSADLERMTLPDLIHPDLRDIWNSTRDRVWANQAVDKFEVVFLKKSGVSLTTEGNLGLSFKRGKPYALRAIFRDISDRRRLEKLKDDFIGILSHEIRTPITIVKGAIDNLRGGMSNRLTDRDREFFEMADRNADRLNKIVDNVLLLSRMESGKATLHRQAIHLPTFVSECLKNMEGEAKKRSIRIFTEIPETLPPAFADADMIMEVLTNLVSNALKFAESVIRIRGRMRSETEIQIGVTDDGVGIPPEKMDQLFDKFVQVTRPRKSDGGKYKGTGLGLAICKEILRMHRGAIWAESPPGAGAAFHFILPRFDDTVALEAALDAAVSGGPAAKASPVLVVLMIHPPQNPPGIPPPVLLSNLYQILEERIQSVLRKEDQIVRLRERLVVLAVMDPAGSASLLARIEDQLKEPFRIGPLAVPAVSMDIGMAAAPADGRTPHELLSKAIQTSRPVKTGA